MSFTGAVMGATLLPLFFLGQNLLFHKSTSLMIMTFKEIL
jgi:hypothetical protein